MKRRVILRELQPNVWEAEYERGRKRWVLTIYGPISAVTGTQLRDAFAQGIRRWRNARRIGAA